MSMSMDNLSSAQHPDGLQQIIAGMQEDQASDKIANKAIAIAADQKANLQEETTEESNPLASALKRQGDKVRPQTSAVKKSKEAKESKKKLMPLEDASKEFSQKNPQFSPDALKGLADKIKDGMSQKEILELIKRDFPKPEDTQLALQFLISVALGDFKELLQLVEVDFNKEIHNKREEEVAKKVELEAVKASEEASAAGLKIVQGGDLNKIFDHLLNNPLQASDIFKMLNEGYGGKNLKKVELWLLKKCGSEIKELNLDSGEKENIAEMKNTMTVLRKLQSLLGVDKYFEARNPMADKGMRK